MPALQPERLLALLRDPNVESAEIAAAAGVAREEVGRAARLLLGLARARPDEVATLPPPLAAALLRAAATAGRSDLVAGLAAHAGKEVAKEARRLLHALKVKGVAVPEPARAAAAPAPAPPAEPPPPSWATAPDGHGERALWVLRAVPGRGLEVAQAVVSDRQGLVELQVALLSRREWRGVLDGLHARGAAMGLGEVERGWALALLASARRLNEGSGQRVPDGADHWLHQQGPPAPLPDPADRLPPLPPAEEAEALAGSGALHDLPVFAGWLAEEPFLREVARQLDEVESSPLALGPDQKAARLRDVVERAVAGYLTPARREALADRLLAAGAHLLGLGDLDAARRAAAAARALRGGIDAADLPFARRLVEKAFTAVALPPAPAAR